MGTKAPPLASVQRLGFGTLPQQRPEKVLPSNYYPQGQSRSKSMGGRIPATQSPSQPTLPPPSSSGTSSIGWDHNLSPSPQLAPPIRPGGFQQQSPKQYFPPLNTQAQAQPGVRFKSGINADGSYEKFAPVPAGGEHPRLAQFRQQDRMQDFSRRSLDAKYAGMETARNNVVSRNQRVRESMGQQPGSDQGGSRMNYGQIDDAVANHNRQVGRNWMSASDRRQISAPQLGEAINGRGVNGSQPGSQFIPQASPDARNSLRFTQGLGRKVDDALASRLRDRADIRRDDKILSNARKYKLGEDIPAVGRALASNDKRGEPLRDAKEAKATEKTNRQLNDAMVSQLLTAQMEHHISHAKTLSPLEAAKYLEGAITNTRSAANPRPFIPPTKGSTTNIPFEAKRNGPVGLGTTSQMYNFRR